MTALVTIAIALGCFNLLVLVVRNVYALARVMRSLADVLDPGARYFREQEEDAARFVCALTSPPFTECLEGVRVIETSRDVDPFTVTVGEREWRGESPWRALLRAREDIEADPPSSRVSEGPSL
ncbi:MAG: hypothetical protein RIS45_1901 [Planctomycetota bacterium]